MERNRTSREILPKMSVHRMQGPPLLGATVVAIDIDVPNLYLSSRSYLMGWPIVSRGRFDIILGFKRSCPDRSDTILEAGRATQVREVWGQGYSWTSPRVSSLDLE